MLICNITDMSFLPPEPMFHSFQDQSNLPPLPLPLPLSPHAISSCSNQDFQGISPILMRRSMSFSGMERCAEEMRGEDELSDDGSTQLGEKKRRLNLEQVKALEKSFELGNKLEPERKTQLARALGLQPRQVAIWFQNRRARWKTKQLERDYDVLKRQFDAVKADNDALKSQNNKLHAQLLAVKGRDQSGIGTTLRPINLNNKDQTEGSWSNGSENSCDINNTGTTPSADSPLYSQIQNNRYNFPTLSPIGSISQLLQTTSTTDLLSQKLNQSVGGDETFCNMFNAIEDQPAFWSWPEQHQNYH